MTKTIAKKEKAAAHRIAVGPRLKAVLKVAFRARRPVLLEGPTGVGKSEVVHQVADELDIGRTILDLSLLEPPDLVGLPVIEGGRTSYAAPKGLPLDGQGILMLEELNRAERYIQQPALQLLTARRLHEYVLPEGWSVVAAINPEEGDYQVTPLDPALRRRFLALEVQADRACWIAWAEANGTHPAVLRLAKQHDDFLEHVPPRTWTYVSQVLQVMHPEELEDGVLMRDVLAGYLPGALVELLLVALRDSGGDRTSDVGRLLSTYHRAPQLQERVRALRDQGQTDRLHQIACRLQSILEGPELNQLVGRGEFSLDAFEALLGDLPGDHRQRLGELVGGNLLVARLLEVQPESILHGGYAGSHLSRSVGDWAKSTVKQYRVRVLAAAVCHHLQNTADIPRLRENTGARVGLGLLIDQVGPELAAPLRRVADQYGLDPIPASGKRKAR